MDLVPWRPFGEMSTFRDEMDRLWNRFFGETPFSRRLRGEWCPTADISETKNSIIVKAELPGLDPKDIDVNLKGNILTIKGEKKKEEEEKDMHHHYVERYHGKFQRSFQLPADVATDKIEATFDKGVLKVTLPKTKESKEQQIEIKVK